MNHSESAHQHIANRQSAFILALAALLVLASTALAQGGYDLSWWAVHGGGVTLSSGGGYTLSGSIGQPHAGVLSGGSYTAVTGFWGISLPPATPTPSRLSLPVLLRLFAGDRQIGLAELEIAPR